MIVQASGVRRAVGGSSDSDSEWVGEGVDGEGRE